MGQHSFVSTILTNSPILALFSTIILSDYNVTVLFFRYYACLCGHEELVQYLLASGKSEILLAYSPLNLLTI